MEGTLETVIFYDIVERGLALPVSEFFYRLLQFWGIQLHHLTPQSILHLSIFTLYVKHSLGFFPISTFFNISSSLSLSPMPPILPSSEDVNWYSVLRLGTSTWLMVSE